MFRLAFPFFPTTRCHNHILQVISLLKDKVVTKVDKKICKLCTLKSWTVFDYQNHPFRKAEWAICSRQQQKEFLQKVPYLTAPVLSVDVTWHWESGLQDFLGIIQWGLQEVLKVFIFRHVLVSSFLPLGNSLLMGQGEKETGAEMSTSLPFSPCMS